MRLGRRRIWRASRQQRSRSQRLRREKAPKQDRSRFTVEALLQAATQVFVADGYDAATTQRIAEVAGVSIGSLYQYYPNKAALVAALAERELERLLRLLQTRQEPPAAGTLEDLVRGYIEMVMRIYRDEPALHQVLITVMPRVAGLAASNAVERRAHGLVRAYLEQHRAACARATSTTPPSSW